MIDARVMPAEGQKLIYLYPGELAVSDQPGSLSTVVGSCVAVCLWDARRKVVGLNHYLLPREPRPEAPSARFGSTAIAWLVQRMTALGCEPRQLVAKVFGGAHVLRGAAPTSGHLGEQNVEVALDALRDLRVPVMAHSTGGTRGRRVIVSSEDGSAWVKEL